MNTKKQTVFPKHQITLEQMGENIKLARKRRKLTAVQVAERANIVRTTLYQIKKGNPSVAIGAYFNVLKVLGLLDDFLKLAADDELGRKLQDLELLKQQYHNEYSQLNFNHQKPKPFLQEIYFIKKKIGMRLGINNVMNWNQITEKLVDNDSFFKVDL